MLPAWLADTVTSDLDRALHYTLLWGLEGVELRTVGGPADRVPHVNVAKLERRLKEAEVLPVSVVPGMFAGHTEARAAWLNELAMFDETLRLCRRIGCPRVVVSAFAASDDEAPADDGTEAAAGALRRAGAAAERHGIALAVLNAYDGAHATGAALARLLRRVDRDLVRAAWDPAAAYRAGEDPSDGLAALEGRLELVRCADGHGWGADWTPAPLGEGAIDWPGQVLALNAQRFRRPVSLVITTAPRPRQGLHAATRLIRALRTAQRAEG